MPRLNDAFLTAHFERGVDISDRDELVRLAVAAGLDEDLARAAVDDESLDEAVQLSIATASSLGVAGVPFYVLDDRYGISGAQPTEVFVQASTQVWDEVKDRPSTPVQPIAGAGEACGPEGCA